MTNGISNSNISEFSIEGTTIGFVLDVNTIESSDSIKAYVPKFMSEIEMGEKIWEENKNISTSPIKNSNFSLNNSSSIISKNYIFLKPYNILGKEANMTKKGEHIEIQFLDNDLTKGRFTPYEVEDTKNQHENNRMRWFIDCNSNDFIETEVEEDTNKKRMNPLTRVSSSSIIDNTDIEFNSNYSNNSRKKSFIVDPLQKIKKSMAKDNRSNNISVKKSDKNYDLVMDSKLGILGLRLEVDKNSNDGTEKSLMSFLLKRKNRLIDIFTDKGNINISNGYSNIKIEGKNIEINNGKVKIKLLEDDIILSNETNSITLSNLINLVGNKKEGDVNDTK